MTKKKTFGKFIIYEELSSGGAATIYRAKNKTTGREVALKVIYEHLSKQPIYRKRLQREVKYISRIDHPNLIKTYGSGENDGKLYIEMEYFPSMTLKDWVIKKKKVSLKDFRDISAQIADGLASLHESNIMHRDLSYGNILINNDNKVKITDFGLIKILPENSQFSQLTELTDVGSTFGTLAFMSPEQCDGREIDNTSDLFSFGVNLYYMLTGELPFKGDTVASIVSAISKEEPESIIAKNRDVSFELQTIIFNMISKKPRNRINNIRDIKKMILEQLRQDEYREKNPLQNNKIIIPLIAIPTISLLLFLSYLLFLMPEKEITTLIERSIQNLNRKGTYTESIKTTEAEIPVEEYLKYEFKKYNLLLPHMEGFDDQEEYLIQFIFLKTVTRIQGFEFIFNQDRETVGDNKHICTVGFYIVRSNDKIVFIEKWISPIVKIPYERSMMLDDRGDEELENIIASLFNNSKLLTVLNLFPYQVL